MIIDGYIYKGTRAAQSWALVVLGLPPPPWARAELGARRDAATCATCRHQPATLEDHGKHREHGPPRAGLVEHGRTDAHGARPRWHAPACRAATGGRRQPGQPDPHGPSRVRCALGCGCARSSEPGCGGRGEWGRERRGGLAAATAARAAGGGRPSPAPPLPLPCPSPAPPLRLPCTCLHCGCPSSPHTSVRRPRALSQFRRRPPRRCWLRREPSRSRSTSCAD